MKLSYIPKTERGSKNEERTFDDHLESNKRPFSSRQIATTTSINKNIKRFNSPSLLCEHNEDLNKKFQHYELEAIKKRYLPANVNSYQPIAKRWNDKKILFDWHPEDDTSDLVQDQFLKKISIQSNYRDKLTQLPRASLHWSEKPLSEMTDRDWRILKEDFSLSTKGGRLPPPLRNWDESQLSPRIIRLLDTFKFTQPTPIQRQAIPIMLENRDLIGLAETGSGKTLAFVIPILQFLLGCPVLDESSWSDGPYALILAPTRELALQIETEASRFTQPLGYRCLSIVGGHSLSEQSLKLRNGAEIIVATPGRLRDSLDQRLLTLNRCCFVVLDEADRLIDLGFEPEVNYILNELPSIFTKPDSLDAEDPLMMKKGLYRQMTMFSATMPPSVERLAKQYLRRPAMAIVGTIGNAVKTVEIRVEMIPEENKKSRLLSLLQDSNLVPDFRSFSCIIFVNHKKTVEYLTKILDSRGYNVVGLHGGKSQEAREAAITRIRDGSRQILIATDIAGRGLDIKNLPLVINYDMAKTIEDFIHRIGRTGRAGQFGLALTFLTPQDTEIYYDLKTLIQKSPISRVPPELANHEAAAIKPGTIKTARKKDETIYAQ